MKTKCQRGCLPQALSLMTLTGLSKNRGPGHKKVNRPGFRKQLTFFVEREQMPRHTDNATRFTMAALARLFDWKNALAS